MTRLNKILVGVLVVQFVLALVILSRGDKVRLATMQPVLAGFDSAQVTRIQVFDKNADKASIDLVKVAAADAWRLASGFDHPVDASKVADLLAKLAAMKSRGPIATTAVRHQQLAVADGEFAKKLIVTTAKGDTTILVGNADAGRTTAVRVAGSPKVFGVTGLTSWGIDIEPARWIDQNYLVVPEDQITRIQIQGPGGSTELERGESGWQLSSLGQPVPLAPGEALDAKAVDKLVGQVAKLVVYKPGDPRRDASKPTATISIWLAANDPASAGTTAVERLPDHVIDAIADGQDYWVHDRALSIAGMIGKPGLEAAVEASRDKLVTRPGAPGAGSGVPGAGSGAGSAPGAPRPAPTPKPGTATAPKPTGPVPKPAATPAPKPPRPNGPT